MRTIRNYTLSVSETAHSSSFETVSLSDTNHRVSASDSFVRLSEFPATNDMKDEKACTCVIL